MRKKSNKKKKRNLVDLLLGNKPGRTIHRLGVFLGGIWIAGLALNLLWPMPDEISKIDSLRDIEMKNISIPNKEINLLILFSENQEESRHNEISSGIILLKLNKVVGINIIQIPTIIELKLPNKAYNDSLSSVCNKSNIKVCAGIVEEALYLSKKSLQGYLIVRRELLSNIISILIDRTSFIEELEKQFKDSETLYNNDLRSMDWTKRLFFDTLKNENYVNIMNKREMVLRNMFKQIKEPENSPVVTEILNKFLLSIDSNLSKRELLSIISYLMRLTDQPKYELLQLS